MSARTTTRKRKPATGGVGDLNARARVHQALQLRILGVSYERIAEQCGIAGGRGAAYRAIQREFDRYQKPAVEEARQLELLRLDALLQRWFPLAIGAKPDRSAAELVLKVSQRRSALMGLDFAAQERPAVETQMIVIGIDAPILDAI